MPHNDNHHNLTLAQKKKKFMTNESKTFVVFFFVSQSNCCNDFLFASRSVESKGKEARKKRNRYCQFMQVKVLH